MLGYACLGRDISFEDNGSCNLSLLPKEYIIIALDSIFEYSA
jgi:hypothetical protein